MAKVDDATSADGSTAGWFKVSEIGLVSSNPDYWGTQVLNDNCGHYTFVRVFPFVRVRLLIDITDRAL